MTTEFTAEAPTQPGIYLMKRADKPAASARRVEVYEDAGLRVRALDDYHPSPLRLCDAIEGLEWACAPQPTP